MPERRDLRASHEDRDQVVEQLRVAAGDGRLTIEELGERLETALAARTYGELERVLLDLPAVPGAAPSKAPAPVSKDILRLQTGSGKIHRAGVWAVPGRLEVATRSGQAIVDFTEAVITRQTMDLTVSIGSGNLLLIVPPEVTVDVESVSIRSGTVRQRARRQPGVPIKLLVSVSGSIQSGRIVVRGPRRTFWDWLLRRPLQPRAPRPY
ncbi:MAG: hypothetical protein JWQ95_5724 [Sphaerisporangium sp.]|nr:hypothetical protein [Sphaerisporangium sp.]